MLFHWSNKSWISRSHLFCLFSYIHHLYNKNVPERATWQCERFLVKQRVEIALAHYSVKVVIYATIEIANKGHRLDYQKLYCFGRALFGNIQRREVQYRFLYIDPLLWDQGTGHFCNVKGLGFGAVLQEYIIEHGKLLWHSLYTYIHSLIHQSAFHCHLSYQPHFLIR